MRRAAKRPLIDFAAPRLRHYSTHYGSVAGIRNKSKEIYKLFVRLAFRSESNSFEGSHGRRQTDGRFKDSAGPRGATGDIRLSARVSNK
jgi:hypothetical protein